MSSPSNCLVFFVNGRKVTVPDPDPEMTLLQYLRYKLHLTGTKAGCGEGGCGACTVMFSRYDAGLDYVKHYAVNSCLAPLCAVHGIAVTTVEGLGSVRTKLHPVQRLIAENHGSQCGFCTPGIIMSMYALLRNHPQPTKRQVYDAFDGNLCRCTGYRPILEGVYPFTKEFSCPKGENCCRRAPSAAAETNGCDTDDGPNSNSLNDKPHEVLYDPSQEPIFPPELKLLSPELVSQSLRFESSRCVWLRPTALAELLDIKQQNPGCKLVTGNTEIGIETKFQQRHYTVLVSPAFVTELRSVTVTATGIRFGASVTLTDLERHLRKAVGDFPEEKTRVFTAFIDMLGFFAGRQIRNVASIGGNVINASPISDLNPLLLACKAEIEFAAKEHGHRIVKMDHDFFRGYRKTRLRHNEILVSVTLPFSTQNEYIVGYKQAHRREDDIAIVNAGLRVDLGDGGSHIEDICLAYGGMSFSTVLATRTMNALRGRPWDESVLEVACSQDMLPSDLPLAPGSPGGMVAYRRTLTLSFFFRFYMLVTQRLQQKALSSVSVQADEDWSACAPLARGDTQSSQVCAIRPSEHSVHDTVGRPILHRAAYSQCTGEAVYLDDLPITEGELFIGLVTSRRAHATLVNVDVSSAKSVEGVVDVIDHTYVPLKNDWDNLEQVFAADKVMHEGQIIAAVVATTPAVAQRAARMVTVTYEDLVPVVTIKDAIDKGCVKAGVYAVETGDVNVGFAQCELTVEGEMHVQAQEHFYLEPHGCVVYPRDVGELEVVTTTQSPTQVQKAITRALGIQANKIFVKVKRIGGGFGGKETRNISIVLPTAIAALRTHRPVRCVLERDEDMCLTGTRHPAYVTYKVGFNKNGKILALDADLYLNMGHSVDLSFAVMETALLQCDNAYNIEHFRVKGHLCPTNLTSCTAFRGFGGPQAIIMTESWVNHVADALRMAPEKVREINFYKEGDIIPCGQTLTLCNLSACWHQCLKMSDYYSRKAGVDQFNRENRWKKRGLKGGALVNIYTDGTVLLAHGGVEMGQGLHTKLIQVVSRELEIPVSSVHVSETSTTTVPNTGPTAASMSSDLYGAAVIDACTQLNQRLDPYKKAKPQHSFKEWACAAYRDRVSLSAVGFYKLDGVSLDWTSSKNTPFSYFSFGAACTEVEIDCLTGDHQVLRTDIVMDVGESINPGIDVGQIEGAFMQGYGLVALEEYKVSPEGVHLSKGPGTYKIPSFANVPQVINVALLKDSKNPRALYSSKGIGEPPLCLATSVLLAIKSAISAARADSGHGGHFRLDTPATPDKIRMACVDQFVAKFEEDDIKDQEKPWTVKL